MIAVSAETIRRRLLIRGHVQGVFFRDATRARARSAGVAGSARNLADGTVEVVLEGPLAAVERLQRFCEQGPPHARVEDVEAQEEAPLGLSGFEVH